VRPQIGQHWGPCELVLRKMGDQQDGDLLDDGTADPFGAVTGSNTPSCAIQQPNRKR